MTDYVRIPNPTLRGDNCVRCRKKIDLDSKHEPRFYIDVRVGNRTAYEHTSGPFCQECADKIEKPKE